MINLFITGMLRSGTTLLQKALNAHPQIRIFYQPFPEFFIETKRRFFADRGIPPEYHVLSHYCQETRYTPADFDLWLEKTVLPRSLVAKLFSDDKQVLIETSSANVYTFSDWYSTLVQRLNLNVNNAPVCSGSKEVLMEEYVPNLLKNNIFCIIIIRDPRDVLTSLDYGHGKKFTGDHRPVLFNVRNWRKSVLFSQALTGFSNFRVFRFEDLIMRPLETLNNLAQMIGLSPFDEQMWQNGLHSDNGHPWKGNSSFGDMQPFNVSAIGKYSKILSETTRLYIEAVCRREMVSLGYAVSPVSIQECKQRIAGFKDPFIIKRAEFLPDYSSRSENVCFEIKRIDEPDDVFQNLNYSLR